MCLLILNAYEGGGGYSDVRTGLQNALAFRRPHQNKVTDFYLLLYKLCLTD